MNKACLLLIVLLLPLSSAITTDLHQSYHQGETIIVKISGNVLEPITPSQVSLLRGHVQVPFNYRLQKLDSSYFISGLAPSSENDYTLVISNIKTTAEGVVQTIDFQQNFSTTNTSVPYSINPGFIAMGDSLDLIITSNLDFTTDLPTTLPEIENLSIEPGENRLSFSSSSFPSELSIVQVGIYSIPVYFSSLDSSNHSTETSGDYNLSVFPLRIDSIAVRGGSLSYPFRLVNYGDTEIPQVNFIYDQNILRVSSSASGFIPPGEYVEFNIEILKFDRNISESVIIQLGSREIDLPIFVSFTDNESKVNTPYLTQYKNGTSGYLCGELEGTFCSSSESCSGESVQALDGNSCCLSSCVSTSSSSNLAWIGWLIAAIVLIIIIIVAARYFKTKKLSAGASTKVK